LFAALAFHLLIRLGLKVFSFNKLTGNLEGGCLCVWPPTWWGVTWFNARIGCGKKDYVKEGLQSRW
jgi:hypothetical protein